MIDNFKGKRATNGLEKNPSNINRKGRPKKSFKYVNDFLKKKGYEVLNKEDYLEFVALLMNCTEDELKRLYNDKNLPMSLRLTIGELNSAKTRGAMLKDIRDFIFGKAIENIRIETKARVLNKDEIKEHLKKFEDDY